MNVKTAKYIAIFSAVGLLSLMGVFLLVVKEKNQTFESTLTEQQKEIYVKDQRITDLMSANKTLDALVRQQNKLIEGESLGDFMAMYEANKVASKVEILVYLSIR